MYHPSDFLNNCSCPSTRYTYEAALKCYLTILHPDEILPASLDEKWQAYFLQTHDIARDLITFSKKCQSGSSSLAPKTIDLYMRVVHLYLRECGIEISPYSLRLLKKSRPKNIPITKESELTCEIVQRILAHADKRQQAEILILISSGMRIGELLQITFSDLNLKTSPAEIAISAFITKTKMPRTVFISTEATNALREWLAVRTAGRHYETEDERIFPYSKSNEIQRFNRLLKKSGLFTIDKKTHRSMIHFHLFRKFFLTEFKLAASAEVAEELAGHRGYLSTSYRRLTQKTMRDEYQKAEPRLTIQQPDSVSQMPFQKSLSHSTTQDILEELNRIRGDIVRLEILCRQIQPRTSHTYISLQNTNNI